MTDRFAGMLWQRFKDLYGQKWIALFQGDEAIESWRVTWASGLDVTADEIKHALARIGTEYPEWPPSFGQFKALCSDAPKPYVALPPPAKVAPSPERAKALSEAVAQIARRSEPWWTPDQVENERQVSLICMQADRFGRESQAGRFLDQCKSAGVISHDNQLVR